MFESADQIYEDGGDERTICELDITDVAPVQLELL